MTRFACDACEKEFYGPPLMDDLEFYLKVELANRYCSVICAERDLEARGLAAHAAGLR